MIEVWGTRKKQNEFFDNCPARHFKSVEDALFHMVKYEFGYGGNVIKISNEDQDVTTIVTETYILGCKDNTYFKGNKNEIMPLIEACVFWCRSIGKDPIHTDIAIDQLTDENGVSKFSALITTMALPILIGASRVKCILAYACGLEDNKDLEAAIKLEDKDIPSAVSLWKELGEGMSFSEFANSLQ